MARDGGNKQNQTVDQEQQGQQDRQRSAGSKMIHLPVELFKAMMHHGKKQLDGNDEDAAAQQLDDPMLAQQAPPPMAPMPMTQAPMPVQGLAPTRPTVPY